MPITDKVSIMISYTMSCSYKMDHACNLPSSTGSTCRSDKLVVNNISGIL